MSDLRRTSCCGVRDYNGLMELRDPEAIMRDLYPRMYDNEDGWEGGAFVLFTCPAQERIMSRLINFIDRHDLGECTLAPTRMNPNSQPNPRNLQAMLFGVNRQNFTRWYERDEDDTEWGLDKIGRMVRNISPGAEREGMVARIIAMDGNELTVRYDNGGEGHGRTKHYELID